MTTMTRTELAQQVCRMREELGYRAFAEELGISESETRQLIADDWRATGCDAMYAYVLELGEQRIAELSLGTMTSEDVGFFVSHVL